MLTTVSTRHLRAAGLLHGGVASAGLAVNPALAVVLPCEAAF
jgi:hypothetical protein